MLRELRIAVVAHVAGSVDAHVEPLAGPHVDVARAADRNARRARVQALEVGVA